MVTSKDDVVSNRDAVAAGRRDLPDRITITAKLQALAGRAVRATQESVAAYHAFETLKTARGNGVLVPVEQKRAAQERQMVAFHEHCGSCFRGWTRWLRHGPISTSSS